MRRGVVRYAVLAVVVMGLLIGLADVAHRASAAGGVMSLEVTFYGAPDNDPPGGSIAHPVIHSTAGGVGTYSNPVTFATDVNEFAVGTRIYYAPLHKYFMMEDDCVQCISDWEGSRHYHVDLWSGYDSNVLSCERALTPGTARIWVSPPSNLPVDTVPIFAGGRCQSAGSDAPPMAVEQPKPAPSPSKSPSPSPSPSASPSKSASPSPSPSQTATPALALDEPSEGPSGGPSVNALADSWSTPVANIVAWPGVAALLLGAGALLLGYRMRRKH